MSEQEALRVLLPHVDGELTISPKQRKVLTASWRRPDASPHQGTAPPPGDAKSPSTPTRDGGVERQDVVVVLPTGAGKSLLPLSSSL